MAEYIERNKTLEMMSEVLAVTPTELYTAGKCIAAIQSMPAADVVAVVRCKDCVHISPPANDDGLVWCGFSTDYVGLDDFCSYGIRREDND